MLGVPIEDYAYMFGDNKGVIKNTLPASTLKKRHNALAYHRVQEAIARGFLRFLWCDGKDNPADVLTKHSGFQQFWPLIQPFLFWKGDTAQCPDNGECRETERTVSSSAGSGAEAQKTTSVSNIYFSDAYTSVTRADTHEDPWCQLPVLKVSTTYLDQDLSGAVSIRLSDHSYRAEHEGRLKKNSSGDTWGIAPGHNEKGISHSV